ncbi:MAG: hypothetical protein ABIJ04_09280 [Bacteroidota bacterium]
MVILLLGMMFANGSVGQFNITISNPEAVAVLLGNYDPAVYTPGVIINHPDSIHRPDGDSHRSHQRFPQFPGRDSCH